MALTDMKLKMIDSEGEHITSQFHLAAGADPALQSGLLTAIDGISTGGVTGIQAAYHDDTAGEDAVTSPYGAPGDGLRLEFQGLQGSPVTVTVRAPTAACFQADGETLDMTFLASFIADLQANITDTSGAATTFLRGKRVWSRRKKN